MNKKLIAIIALVIVLGILAFTERKYIKDYVSQGKRSKNIKKVEPIPFPENAESNAEISDYLHSVYAKVFVPNNRFANIAMANYYLNSPEPTDPKKKFDYYFSMCSQLVNAGKIDEAIRFINVYESKTDINKMETSERKKWLAAKAITYMRYGEIQNCISNHNSESCIMPFSKAAVHTNLTGVEKAIEIYLQILHEEPKDLTNTYMLNIACMAAGTYPDGVPAEFLIPPSAFASEYNIGKFENIAEGLGVDFNDMCGGVIMDDFNNDGFIDMFTCGWGLKEQCNYIINNGDGTFTNLTESAGLKNYPGGLYIVQTDYNNDGFLDVFITRGAWLAERGIVPNSLLRNNGDNTFTDVTASVGLISYNPTQSATWSDFNNDGWVDLFIGNESFRNKGINNPSELYINDHGNFKNIAKEAGVDVVAFIKGVSTGDYDNDGDADLYVSINGEENILFQNITEKGSMKIQFKDVSKEAGITGPVRSFPCAFLDFNNDGLLDIINFSYSANQSDRDIPAEYLGVPIQSDIPALYINNGDGTFKDIAKEAGLNKTFLVMGCNYGDLDMDGYIDFYLGTGKPSLRSLIPNRVLRNDNGKYLQDVTTSAGMGHLQKGHAISFADLNGDGYPEIFAQMGGAYEADGFRDCLFSNPANYNNHFVSLDLQGTITNRAAIGARIKVTVLENGVVRNIYETVSNGASFGANDFRMEIGLGKATQIKEIIITWPTSGTTQTFKDVSMDQHYRVIENNNSLIPVNVPFFKFQKPETPMVHDHHAM